MLDADWYDPPKAEVKAIREETHLVDCKALELVFNEYLSPYIGSYDLLVEKREMIMMEALQELKMERDTGIFQTRMHDFLDTLSLPTDIKERFLSYYYSTLHDINDFINDYFKTRLLVDIERGIGWTLLCKVITYEYHQKEE